MSPETEGRLAAASVPAAVPMGYRRHGGTTSSPPSSGWGSLPSTGGEMFFGYIGDVPMRERLSIS